MRGRLSMVNSRWLVAIAALGLGAALLAGPFAQTARSIVGEQTAPTLSSVSGGNESACALLADGSVACWGSNWTGALGIGTEYNSVIPRLVDLGQPATQVTVGEAHACALLEDGTLRCWGRNDAGQVGSGMFEDAVLTPTTVPGMDHVVSIGAGAAHTCAVRDDGTAWCWGDGSKAGVPDLWGQTPPTQVPGISSATAVATGSDHSCLLLEDGTVSCFGYLPDGEGGDPDDRYEQPTAIAGFANVTALAGGGDFACGLLGDGTVRCVGGNWFGQLGDGTRIDRGTALAVVGMDDVIALGAGGAHACAMTAEGGVWCWGRDSDGELGRRPSDDYGQDIPVPVAAVAGATAVDGGGGFTCAVAIGVGTCWGLNDIGQLGDRTVKSRHQPAPLSWLPDASVPTCSAPQIQVRRDARLHPDEHQFRVRIFVPAEDAAEGTGIDHVEVRYSKDGGATWGPINWHGQTWHRWLATTGTLTPQVRAVDRAGNASEWVTGPELTPRIHQETSPAIGYHGAWQTADRPAFAGGSAAYTKEDGASATMTFTGRSFGLVSKRGPTRGAFRVVVDGETWGILDLHAREPAAQYVAFSRLWATSEEHTIKLVAVLTPDHPRVDLDAFIVIE